jgi:hypothetical protein
MNAVQPTVLIPSVPSPKALTLLRIASVFRPALSQPQAGSATYQAAILAAKAIDQLVSRESEICHA